MQENTLEHPIAKMILDSAQKGKHVIIKIDPKFFSTWDFANRNDFESNFAMEIDLTIIKTI